MPVSVAAERAGRAKAFCRLDYHRFLKSNIDDGFSADAAMPPFLKTLGSELITTKVLAHVTSTPGCHVGASLGEHMTVRTMGNKAGAAKWLRGVSATALTAAMVATSMPANAVISRDDIGNTNSIDTENRWAGVGQMIVWENRNSLGFGLCTGALIAPRVVLFAGHCVNSLSSEAYGNGGVDMAFMFNPNNLPALRQWVGLDRSTTPVGATNVQNNVYRVIDVIMHPLNLNFPFAAGRADVALAVLDTPAENLPIYDMLFSPLTGPERFDIVGYGNRGTGTTGQIGIDWRRRAGENIMAFLGSDNDVFTSPLFGGAADPGWDSDLYWYDMDDPLRQNPADFNVFNDRALPREASVGQGDSGGSAWITRDGRPVSIGVASYGYSTGPRFGYGSFSAYTPLFPYWDFIVSNNAYVYANARTGGGAWEDGATWVQGLNPNYFITGPNGQLVNALPTTAPVSSSGAAPNFGGVRNPPLRPVDPGFTPPAGTGAAETAAADAAGTDGAVTRNLNGVQVTREGLLPGGGLYSLTGETTAGTATLAATDGATAATTAADSVRSTRSTTSSGFFPVGATPMSGLGSTGFVPNNTLGQRGVAFQNPARFFEVVLTNTGTVTLSSTREIDRLRIANAGAGLTINSGARLNTVMGSTITAGQLTVNGTFAPRALTLTGGRLTGTGTIIAPNGVSNVGGLISPGTVGTVGTLTITGPVNFDLAGTLGIDIDSATTADRLNVTGALTLGSVNAQGTRVPGGIVVPNAVNGFAPAFGQSWTIASATSLTGTFASATDTFAGVLFPRLEYTAAAGANPATVRLVVDATPFRNVVTTTNATQAAFAAALDTARTSSLAALRPLFNRLDLVPVDDVGGTLERLNPDDAYLGRQTARSQINVVSTALTSRLATVRAGGGEGVSVAALAPSLYNNPTADNALLLSLAATEQQVAQDAAPQAPIKEGWGLYLDARYVEGNVDRTPTGLASDLETKLVTVGLDKRMEDGSVFGGALSYAWGDTQDRIGAVASESSTFTVAGYYGLDTPDVFVDAYVLAGRVDVETTRSVLGFVLDGETDGTLYGAGATVGRDVKFDATTGFIPELRADFATVDLGGYTENGGAAALIVPSDRLTTFQLSAGGTLYANFKAKDAGFVKPTVTARLVRELVSQDDSVLSASFAAAPGITVPNLAERSQDKTWAEVGVGLGFILGENTDLTFSYESTIAREDLETETLMGTLRLRF